MRKKLECTRNVLMCAFLFLIGFPGGGCISDAGSSDSRLNTWDGYQSFLGCFYNPYALEEGDQAELRFRGNAKLLLPEIFSARVGEERCEAGEIRESGGVIYPALIDQGNGPIFSFLEGKTVTLSLDVTEFNKVGEGSGFEVFALPPENVVLGIDGQMVQGEQPTATWSPGPSSLEISVPVAGGFSVDGTEGDYFGMLWSGPFEQCFMLNPGGPPLPVGISTASCIGGVAIENLSGSVALGTVDSMFENPVQEVDLMCESGPLFGFRHNPALNSLVVRALRDLPAGTDIGVATDWDNPMLEPAPDEEWGGEVQLRFSRPFSSTPPRAVLERSPAGADPEPDASFNALLLINSEVLPHVPFGEAGPYLISTQLVVNNPHSVEVEADLRFFNSVDGQPQDVTIEEITANHHSFFIPAAQSRLIEIDGTGVSPVTTAWAFITGSRRLGASANFITFDASAGAGGAPAGLPGTAILAEAGIAASETGFRHVLNVSRDGGVIDTAFAVVNPTQSDASLTLRLKSDAAGGETVAEKNIPFEARHQQAFFFGDFFELAPGPFSGAVEIASDTSLAVASLKTLSGLQSSSLPAGSR